MRIREVCLGVGLTVLCLAAPSGAGAAAVSVTNSTVGTPSSQLLTHPGPAALDLNVDFGYTGSANGMGGCGTLPDPDCNYSPAVDRFVITLDPDYAIDPGGLPQCPLASINSVNTASAIAACPGSVVGDNGTGTLNLLGTLYPAVVTAFVGPPSGGDPVIFFHFRVNAPLNVTSVFTGTVTSPNVIDVDVPTIPGDPTITEFRSDLDQISTGSGTLVSSRCTATPWSYPVQATYDGGLTHNDSVFQPCSPQSSVDVSVAGTGTGQVTGPGITCPPDCTGGVLLAGSFSLQATPTGGSTFAGWGGDCAPAGTGECFLTGSADRVATATFVAAPTPAPTSKPPTTAKKCKKKAKKRQAAAAKKCKKKKSKKP